MDSFLEQPGKLAVLIGSALKDVQEQGEINEQEVEHLLQAGEMPIKAPTLSGPAQVSVLRGEGGSGELSRPVPALEDFLVGNLSGGEEVEDPEDHHSEASFRGGDVVADEGDVSTQPSDHRTSNLSRGGVVGPSFREYCDEQFHSITSLITSLQARIEVLEMTSARAISSASALGRPTSFTPGSPPRVGRPLSGGAHLGGGQTSPPINKEVVVNFFRLNAAYPSLTAVRKAKLKNLLGLLGVERRDLDMRVSEWSVEGIIRKLEVEYMSSS